MTVPKRRQQLSEFIEVRLPDRDRRGWPIPVAKRNEWLRRLESFLLNDLGATGSERWRVEAAWLGAYDRATGRVDVMSERSWILRVYCTRAQLRDFRERGEAFLMEMGTALNQPAVAYATRSGLSVLYLE